MLIHPIFLMSTWYQRNKSATKKKTSWTQKRIQSRQISIFVSQHTYIFTCRHTVCMIIWYCRLLTHWRHSTYTSEDLNQKHTRTYLYISCLPLAWWPFSSSDIFITTTETFSVYFLVLTFFFTLYVYLVVTFLSVPIMNGN